MTAHLSQGIAEGAMQYQYLRGFPAAILPRLEIIVLTAERAHPLTGHGGIRTAVADVTAFAVQAFCGCASVLCDAVPGGQIAYVDLSAQFEFLRRALIGDGFGRSDINYWRGYERGPSRDDFERKCNAQINSSAEWRAVQDRRLALAEFAAAIAAGPTPHAAPASDSRATPETALIAEDSSSPAMLPTTKIGEVVGALLDQETVQPGSSTNIRRRAGESTTESLALALSESRKRVVEPPLSKKGWSPRQWAVHAGVDRSVIYGYLSGTSRPHAENRKAIAEALGLAERDLPE